MRAFYLDDNEIELIKDLRTLTEHERHVLAGAIRRSAQDKQPIDAGSNRASLRVVQD
jgi:hypothetical protein